MSYFKRLLSTITGRARQRLPEQMALLGAPPDLVERVRQMGDEDQEEAFAAFVRGKHGCTLDWKAQRDDVFSELLPLLTPEEARLLPDRDQCPAEKAGTVARIRRALSEADRALVHTESLGDFSFLILVPKHSEQKFLRVVGPWLIDDGTA